ncbi:MAG: universal stress protein [Microscillaceae bacterium]|nr:universal stress protein [Microscillaceae bacterium]
MRLHSKKEQLRVLEDLQAFREILGAHLHLLYVNVPNDFYTHREIHQRKEAFLAEAHLGEVSFHIYNEVNEENGILYFAEDHQLDMIVVATHQRTGLAHLISGSIAEDVVNHAKRPVLTFGLKYRHKVKS